jgi:hypothetical protein
MRALLNRLLKPFGYALVKLVRVPEQPFVMSRDEELAWRQDGHA